MSDLPRFLLSCTACQISQVLLTGRREGEELWLALWCPHCGATQQVGPLAMEHEEHKEEEWNPPC